MRRAILLVIVLAVVLGFLFWQYGGGILNSPQIPTGPITLTYWVTTEDEIMLSPVVAEYQTTHPNIKINLVKQSLLNYRTRLQTQLRVGQGPDVFQIHNSWLPMLKNDLSIVPDSMILREDYKRNYYPVFLNSLTENERIYALPTNLDGLALFYNEDILKGAGASVPKSWADFADIARRVTVRDQTGKILTSGAALGTTKNIDYWPEIIALLFLQQPEANLLLPASLKGAEVLQFYTSFVTDPRYKTWDYDLPSSSKMFTDGRLAFYFAPARQIKLLQESNPNFSFKVAPVPQLPGKIVALGSFWAEAVSGRSSHQAEAWELVKFISSAETLQKINQAKTTAGQLNRVYPQVSLGGAQINDPLIGAFVGQGPYYQSWYLNSDTGDAGLNEEMVKLFEGAINATLQGQDSLASLQAITPQIKQILDKYTNTAIITPR